MDRMQFYCRLYPYLIKQNIIMRESIKRNEQSILFLRYIAIEETFHSLEYQFRVYSRRSIGRIVKRVAKAIVEVLHNEHLKTLNTVNKLLEI